MSLAHERGTGDPASEHGLVLGLAIALIFLVVGSVVGLSVWSETSLNPDNQTYRLWLRNDTAAPVIVQFGCGEAVCIEAAAVSDELAPGGSQLISVGSGRVLDYRVVSASGRPIGCLTVAFQAPNGLLPDSALPVEPVSQLDRCPAPTGDNA
jgi:hypothetical protein